MNLMGVCNEVTFLETTATEPQFRGGETDVPPPGSYEMAHESIRGRSAPGLGRFHGILGVGDI